MSLRRSLAGPCRTYEPPAIEPTEGNFRTTVRKPTKPRSEPEGSAATLIQSDGRECRPPLLVQSGGGRRAQRRKERRGPLHSRTSCRWQPLPSAGVEVDQVDERCAALLEPTIGCGRATHLPPPSVARASGARTSRRASIPMRKFCGQRRREHRRVRDRAPILRATRGAASPLCAPWFVGCAHGHP